MYLNLFVHVTENVVDLVLETSGQHLVGLVQNEDFDGSVQENMNKQVCIIVADLGKGVAPSPLHTHIQRR